MSSNVGKWDRWYHGVTLDEPQAYGGELTYELGVDWLRGCSVVYDLGCGKGGFTKVAKAMGAQFDIVGVDGSVTPFAHITMDLVDFALDPPPQTGVGVFMRHVLEHEPRWREVLVNALDAFDQRAVIVLFTPLVSETRQITWSDDPGVPDISFSESDIIAPAEERGIKVSSTTLRTATQYGIETVFYLERGA